MVPGKDKQTVRSFSPNIVTNFSSYILSERELEVLSYSLDHYIPYKADARKIEVAFEQFYTNIIPCTTNLSESEKISLKSKF